MKKTKKRILGLLGLVLVIITTIFAACLPGPEASAEEPSVTDTVSVRVVGSQPDVSNVKPVNGSIFVYPNQDLSFDYENVEYITITLYYTDKDDVEHTIELLTKDDPESFVDYNAGSYSKSLDLLAAEYGYGEYRAHIEGIGYKNVTDFEDTTFSLYPVYGTVEGADDGSAYVDLHYDTTNPNIHTIGINVYDENGNLVKTISPIEVESPETKVNLPFSKNDLETGKYRIEITAYDPSGEALYKPYTTYYYYESRGEDIPVPNTGGLFGALNISRADYVVTGILIFLSVAILGIIFVVKDRDSKKRASIKRNRR